MPAGAVDPGIGDRTGTKDELIVWRKGINPRRIFLHEEISTESLSTQIGFIN
jgi:hypothetical protein